MTSFKAIRPAFVKYQLSNSKIEIEVLKFQALSVEPFLVLN